MHKDSASCSCGKPKYAGKEVCYDCYEAMFDHREDTNFEIKNEVARISPSKHNDSIAFLKSGDSLYNTGNLFEIKNPKRVVLNTDIRDIDYEKLVVFLLNNMVVCDNAIGFDKVSWMFKYPDS
ncbi:MAG TPA: hypothetical protein VKU94_06330 [Geobacterales bacterium]|nr:hypothetical protein [Geobacterales bacterium]